MRVTRYLGLARCFDGKKFHVNLGYLTGFIKMLKFFLVSIELYRGKRWGANKYRGGCLIAVTMSRWISE